MKPASHFEAMNAALDAVAAHGLSQIEAHVLLVYAYRANYRSEGGWARPSMRSLQDNLALKPSRIYAALKRLRDLGILEHKPASPGRVAQYRLSLDVSTLVETNDRGEGGNVSTSAETSDPNVSTSVEVDLHERGPYVSTSVEPEGPTEGPNEKGDSLGLSEGREAKASHPHLKMAGMVVDWITRGTDTLDGDLKWMRPTVEAVIPMLVELDPTWEEAERAAKETYEEIVEKGDTYVPANLFHAKLTRIVAMREWKAAA